jgi:hypothetical protein
MEKLEACERAPEFFMTDLLSEPIRLHDRDGKWSGVSD